MPAKTERPTRSRRWTKRSARLSRRTAPVRTPPTISSANPVVCLAIASRTSGLEATCRRARWVSSLASTRSVSSIERGLASAAFRRRSSSPLEASSATTRSMTRWRTSERAISSGSDPANARSMTRANSGAESTSSTAASKLSSGEPIAVPASCSTCTRRIIGERERGRASGGQLQSRAKRRLGLPLRKARARAPRDPSARRARAARARPAGRAADGAVGRHRRASRACDRRAGCPVHRRSRRASRR